MWFAMLIEALGEGFDKTKGFIYRFSEKGVHKLRESKWAECLLPFFDEARDEGVNGFVLNVLCVDVEAGDEGGYAVGWHRDATVGFRVGADVAGIRQKIADSVTVIYVSLPVGESMRVAGEQAPTVSQSGDFYEDYLPSFIMCE